MNVFFILGIAITFWTSAGWMSTGSLKNDMQWSNNSLGSLHKVLTEIGAFKAGLYFILAGDEELEELLVDACGTEEPELLDVDEEEVDSEPESPGPLWVSLFISLPEKRSFTRF